MLAETAKPFLYFNKGGFIMKAFFAGLAVALLMAVGASFILGSFVQKSAQQTYTTSSARPPAGS